MIGQRLHHRQGIVPSFQKDGDQVMSSPPKASGRTTRFPVQPPTPIGVDTVQPRGRSSVVTVGPTRPCRRSTPLDQVLRSTTEICVSFSSSMSIPLSFGFDNDRSFSTRYRIEILHVWKDDLMSPHSRVGRHHSTTAGASPTFALVAPHHRFAEVSVDDVAHAAAYTHRTLCILAVRARSCAPLRCPSRASAAAARQRRAAGSRSAHCARSTASIRRRLTSARRIQHAQRMHLISNPLNFKPPR